MVVTFPRQSVDTETAECVRRLVESIDDPRLEKPWRWVEAEIHPALERATPVEQVHTMWNPDFVSRYPSPAGLPRLEPGSLCDAGAILVEVSCISRRSGGMGSNYQFDGYFVSLVLAPDLSRIVDARIDRAY